MQKRTPDYDNVFKTMKSKHKRLFISVINDTFGKNYPMDAKIEMLPSEGYMTESETTDGSKDIEEQISDFVIKILAMRPFPCRDFRLFMSKEQKKHRKQQGLHLHFRTGRKWIMSQKM